MLGLFKVKMAAVKFAQSLKELRIHLCQRSATSQGVRDFVEKYYVGVKQANPNSPILIRECSNIQPKIYARYELGREMSMPLGGLSGEQVLETIKTLSSKQT
ncbi:unnamed protein product [Owenia fusiformis]|uniref:NADH dehydrogenase [ubiquinone] 1 alpha subcomplex subunit 2 n=1 Tax=Owenia fusiformis TaxID=6347 RepID=A0A8S4NCH7_OWEFU|nr:unnamed protein product [Owenia fusiformis]